MNCDALGTAKVRRRGEEGVKLGSEHMLFHKGSIDNSIGGVGFMIKKQLTSNLEILKVIPDRIIYITLKIIKVYQLNYPNLRTK